MSFLSSPQSLQKITLAATPGDLPGLVRSDGKMGITRARLQGLLSLFAPLYGKYRVVYDRPPGDHIESAIRQLLLQKTMPTLDNCFGVARILLGNPGNIRLACEALPTAYRKILDRILSTAFISTSDVTDILQQDLEKYYLPTFGPDIRRATFTSNEAATMPFIRVANEWSSYYNNPGYSLEPFLLSLIGSALGLAKYSGRSTVTDVLPDSQLETFDGSGEILAQINPLIDHYRSATYTFGTTSVKVSEINEMAARLQITEFFKSNGCKALSYTRKRTLLTLMADGLANISYRWIQPAAPARAFKEIFESIWLSPAKLVALAMPHFKNIYRSNIDSLETRSVTDPVIRVIKKYADKKSADGTRDPWIEADSLIDEILLQEDATYRDWMSFEGGLPRNTISDDSIYYDDLYNQWYTQLVLGYIAMLASAGLVELAIRPMLAETPVPWTAIRYVRLTGLGRYVFGLDETFHGTIAEIKRTAGFELDADRLLITVLDSKSMKFLKDRIGTPITSNRLKVDETSFLRGVTNAAEIKARIDKLKQIGGIDEFPPVWRNFFDRLTDRAGAFWREDPDDYAIYHISADRPELLQLLSADEQIRPLVILAEGPRILVSHDNLSTLKKLLGKHGYRL